MGFRINTNIGALQAHTSAVMNNKSLDNSLARLSSGLRINKAADDASGLAIADSLKAQASGLNQAINNANDGVAVVQTADGALDEYTSIINTVRTKAIQAASDGQNADSRAAIQRDINKLLEEAQNIVDTTSFNGLNLLDGSFSNKNFQIGAYANQTVGVSINNSSTDSIGKLATYTSTTTQTSLIGIVSGDLASTAAANITSGKYAQLAASTSSTTGLKLNNIDLAGALAGQGGSQYSAKGLAAAMNAVSADTNVTATASTSWTGTGSISGGTIADGGLNINGINIGPVTVKSNDADGALVSAINAQQSKTGVTASVDGSGKLTLLADKGENIALYNGGGYNANSFTSTLGTGFVDNRTTVGLTATYTGTAVGTYTMNIDGKDFSFATATDTATTQANMESVLGGLDSTIYSLDLTGADAKITRVDGKDINIIGESETTDGNVAIAGYTAAGVANAVAGNDILIANNSYHGTVSLVSDSAVEVAGDATALRSFGFNTDGTTTSVVQSASGGISDADVTTFDAAQTTIQRSDSALKALDTIRSELGSVQNQLESTVRNISVTAVNVTAAESQIRDVDFAQESANFSKYNILAQSGSYAMSQANAVQQNVLRLLQ